MSSKIDPWRQSTMFGVSALYRKNYVVFHDESGTYGGRDERWLFHGLLFVPIELVEKAMESLNQIRRATNYWGEVHFVKLRGSSRRPRSLCAAGWVNTFFSELIEGSYFKCLAIDTESEAFDSTRFSEDYLAYNYFTKLALVGAIAWFFPGIQEITVRLISDHKRRGTRDNFKKYILPETANSIEEKRLSKPGRYPKVLVPDPVAQTLPRPNASSEELGIDTAAATELLQLSDLLTSSCAQAVKGSSKQQGKVDVAKSIAKEIEDVYQAPWLQRSGLRRRFSVSSYPSAKGSFYNPELMVNLKKQPKLFE